MKPEGGGRGYRVTREGAIHVTNVNLVCPETGWEPVYWLDWIWLDKFYWNSSDWTKLERIGSLIDNTAAIQGLDWMMMTWTELWTRSNFSIINLIQDLKSACQRVIHKIQYYIGVYKPLWGGDDGLRVPSLDSTESIMKQSQMVSTKVYKYYFLICFPLTFVLF